MAQSARRRAFNRVPETCPSVDDALAEAARRIKQEATEELRDALIEAYTEVEGLEERVQELEYQVSQLEDLVAELRDTNRQLQAKIESLAITS